MQRRAPLSKWPPHFMGAVRSPMQETMRSWLTSRDGFAREKGHFRIITFLIRFLPAEPTRRFFNFTRFFPARPRRR